MRAMIGMLSEIQRRERLQQALTLSETSVSQGIGTQKERTLHSVLKYYLEPDAEYHEIPIGSFIADIYRDDRIIEVQTGSFTPLAKKLDAFLPEFPVTIVYPIPWHKWVHWIQPDTGEVSKGRRSPKTGHLYMLLPELYRIRPYLMHPHLCLLPILIDLREYRYQDGWGRDGKRGSHRADRVPFEIGPTKLLTGPADYISLLPDSLPESFTMKDFIKATRFSPRSASYALSALREIGVARQIGQQGRSYLYTITEEETFHAL